jgi:hypothetical protein
MPEPSADAFAALARSSPWRWSTLRFSGRWNGDGPWRRPLRAWVRRPDLLRVETLDGELLQVVRQSPQRVSVLTSDGGVPRELPWWTAGPSPELRPDGLVATRPDRLAWDFSLDAPMFQDYRWIAMLDPAELADGRDPESEAVTRAVAVDTVTEVDHGGRPAWEAIVRTTPSYEPRCSCCPLLHSRESDLLEYGPEGVQEDYPRGYRVRLDVGTGVCVLTEELGGTPRGIAGHDLRIEAVDEPMPDGLFRPRSSQLSRYLRFRSQ